MRYFALALVALLALFHVDMSFAQQWPQRPVRLIVPYAPGGNTDVIARLLAQRLSTAFGQPFIIENRAGAGGAIAADFVAKAPADGYVMCVCALSQVVPVPLMQSVGYDPLKDFTPIANVGANGFVISVSSKVPVKTLEEFIAYVKSHPGQLNYGSGGTGSLTHLAALLFLQHVGLEMTHVPYKGGAPALADTLAGQVQMYAASPSEIIGYAGGDRINLLGISALKRISQMPSVPAIAETYPGFQALTWNGLIGPAKMPDEIVNRLADEIRTALTDPVFVERFAAAGVEPAPTTPQGFAAQIRKEYAMWRDAIKRAGIAVR